MNVGSTHGRAEAWPDDNHKRFAGPRQKLLAARGNLDNAMNKARETAIAAAAAGIPETVIARELIVNRMTVRRWLDK